MKFSDRYGITQPRKVFQTNSMDDTLRNRLYNVIFDFLLSGYYNVPVQDKMFDEIDDDFYFDLWRNFFKYRIDEMKSFGHDFVDQFRTIYNDLLWYEVYNLIEFIYENEAPINKEDFKNSINKVLDSELAGYKFIEDKLVPITEEKEVEEIEDSLKNMNEYGIVGAKEHISVL
jgi:hypothetical protein